MTVVMLLSVFFIGFSACSDDDENVTSLENYANSTWVGYASEWNEHKSEIVFVPSNDTIKFGDVTFDSGLQKNVISTGKIVFGKITGESNNDKKLGRFSFWYDDFNKCFSINIHFYKQIGDIPDAHDGTISKDFTPEGKDKLNIGSNYYYTRLK